MGKLARLEELFAGWRFDREVIILCVRWYLRFKLSLRDLVEMVGLPHSPACTSLAPCSPPSMTLRAAQARWPTAIIERGCARRLAHVRPGRGNGPCQTELRNHTK
jgi:hypothetical protein